MKRDSIHSYDAAFQLFCAESFYILMRVECFYSLLIDFYLCLMWKNIASKHVFIKSTT